MVRVRENDFTADRPVASPRFCHSHSSEPLTRHDDGRRIKQRLGEQVDERDLAFALENGISRLDDRHGEA